LRANLWFCPPLLDFWANPYFKQISFPPNIVAIA
jgi:hypothetical protein